MSLGRGGVRKDGKRKASNPSSCCGGADKVKVFNLGVRVVGCNIGRIRQSVGGCSGEAALLSVEVVRSEMTKKMSEMKIGKVLGEAEEHMVCLSAVLGGGNPTEKLTRSQLTESVKAFDAVVQLLGHDALNRI